MTIKYVVIGGVELIEYQLRLYHSIIKSLGYKLNILSRVEHVYYAK